MEQSRKWLTLGVMLMALLFAFLVVWQVECDPAMAQSPSSTNSVRNILPGEYWQWWVKQYFHDQDSTWAERSPLFIGKTLAVEGRVLMAVRNKEGDTLKIGDCAVWDTTRIIVCDTLKLKPGRIENDLTGESGKLSLYVVADGTASDDSLLIWGLDEDGAAQSETVEISDGANSYTKSANWWTQIDSVKDSQSAGGWDSYDVYALPYFGVRASDGATNDFAGIASGMYNTSGTWVAYILDNEVGFIVTHGFTSARCDGNSTNIWPGDMLFAAAGGDMAPLSNADTGFPLDSLQYPAAKATEYLTADNTLIKVFVR